MMKRRSKDTGATGAEALFLAALTYAITGILVREVSPMWGDKAQVAARFLLVTLFVAAYCLLRREPLTIPRSKLPIAIGLGLSFAGMVLFFTVAIGKTTIANVLFVFYASNMVASFIAGTVFLKERVARDKLLALAFAIAGLALYSGAFEAGSLGIIFAVVAGVFSGVVNICSKLLTGIERNPVIIVQYAVASVFTVVLTLLSGDQIVRTASVRGSLLTVLFAVVIILGSNLTLYGFQHFDVNIGSVIMSSELVFAAILGYLLFHEMPAVHELLGGALVFVGSIVSSGVIGKHLKPLNVGASRD